MPTALRLAETELDDAPRRVRLASAREGPLLFGAVREDPLLEIEVLRPAFAGRIALVASGGCTALSLLASGARQVVAVDLNPVQNHLVELKHAAVSTLGPHASVTFLGLGPATRASRLASYAALRGALGADAQRHWDERPALVARGAHHAGRSERFIRLVATVLRLGVHGRARSARLLRARSLDEQRALYEREWNTWRFRLLYRLLLNPLTLRRALDPACLRHVPEAGFDRLFLGLFERGLFSLPVGENYFLHEMLTGRYPDEARPPWLQPAGAAHLASGRLQLVDGAFTDFLRTERDQSLDALALSNICEWLDEAEQRLLFAEVVRVLRPGGYLVFRNFLGHTQVPEAFADALLEQPERGRTLIARDRSLLQQRLVICRLRPGGHAHERSPLAVRPARPDDNAALLDLARGCPMEGELTLCVERAPDFFALQRLEGRRTRVLVAESEGRPVGCVGMARRDAYLNGQPVETLYVGDLKVDPRWRGRGVADALSAAVSRLGTEWVGPDAPVVITVLHGNQAMERRLDGPRGLPSFRHVARLRSLSFPALRRRARTPTWLRLERATAANAEEMQALWRKVAAGRQFAQVVASADELLRFAESAPGLGLASYLLARDTRGSLLGFLAVWEQSSLKELRVLRDSKPLAWARPLLARLGPLLGLPPVARPGEALRCATVYQLCVPPGAPRVLQALLRRALVDVRAAGLSFLNLGLDARDPLLAGTRGLFGLETLLDAYVCTPGGPWRGAAIDPQPLHFETALA